MPRTGLQLRNSGSDVNGFPCPGETSHRVGRTDRGNDKRTPACRGRRVAPAGSDRRVMPSVRPRAYKRTRRPPHARDGTRPARLPAPRCGWLLTAPLSSTIVGESLPRVPRLRFYYRLCLLFACGGVNWQDQPAARLRERGPHRTGVAPFWRRQRVHSTCWQRARDHGSQVWGSTGPAGVRTSKCRCGPVDAPVEPTSPMTCPAATCCPDRTSSRDWCA